MNFHWQGMGRAGQGAGGAGDGGADSIPGLGPKMPHARSSTAKNQINKSGAEWGRKTNIIGIISADVGGPKILTHR